MIGSFIGGVFGAFVAFIVVVLVIRNLLEKETKKEKDDVCEACRYFSWDEDEVGHCAKGVDDGTDWSNYQIASGDVVEGSFYCNKFTKKDES